MTRMPVGKSPSQLEIMEFKMNPHWITDYKGEWQVCSIGTYWYIYNTVSKRLKKIGAFRWNGTNYCDKARMEAEKRNNEVK